MRLAEFAQQRAPMPFAWGKNDCCLFAADAVLAMTGVDHAAQLRGYSTALGAQRKIEVAGGLRDLVVQILGEPVSPLMAAVGDVVLVENEGRELLAVCNGTSAIAPGPHGMVALDMAAALSAWKI